jgi:alpha-tubulin suppressor-like RCC1 family protein
MKASRVSIVRALGWTWLVTLTFGLFVACSSGTEVEPIASTESGLTKGQPGAVNGASDYCADPANLCAAGEGHCTSTDQCVSGLKCKSRFGPRYGMSNTVSVCMPPTCYDNVQNGSETGLDCGGTCAPCRSNCSAGTNGTAGFCASGGCLCGQGQGDCTVNGECQPGLTCQRIGAQFALSASVHVCAPPNCSDGVQNGNETGVDCGGSCGSCLAACVGTPGSATFCDTCKCASGQGDCDSNLQCASGLVCARLGNQFNQSATTDVCVPAHCADSVQNAGETGVDCGGSCGACLSACSGTLGDASYCTGCKCTAGQGDCDGNSECQLGLTCQRKGNAFGLGATTDVCLSPSCSNNVQDGGETGVDCGGTCGACFGGEFDAGTAHACVVAYGGVRCWGANASGQLGDGTTGTYRSTPAPVTGLIAGYSLVTAGGSHSCAVSGAGVVKCWGANNLRQLGNGSTTNSPTPVNVSSPPANITKVRAGNNHTCALTSAGTVYCWGDNSSGQSGNSVGGTVNAPTQVTGITTAVDLAAGDNHTCVALADTTVRCWGLAANRQLGNNSGVSTGTPVTAAGVTGAIGIAAAERHTCALISGGTVFCWGSNADNSLGLGVGINGRIPAQVVGLTGATGIATAGRATCATTATGAKCWGYSSEGEVGDGTTLAVHTSPTTVAGLAGGATVRGGGTFFCARVGSSLSCWGDDTLGALGKGTISLINAPKRVQNPPTSVSALSAGDVASCAVSGGNVYCWGQNDASQLGDGTSTQRREPRLVSGVTGATGVAVGGSHACAVLASGALQCWGSNIYGQLGTSTPASTAIPITVPGVINIAQVYAGSNFTCARRTNGTLLCWGENNSGQLGMGNTTASSTPTVVPGVTGVTAAAAGPRGFCAVVTGGALRCWGSNSNGQVGNGSTTDATSPVAVSGVPSAASSVVVGARHSCALLTNGQVYCWGDGSSGQLGNGSFNSSLAPVQATGITNAVSLSAFGSHTCAVISTGRSVCWGENFRGQLGNLTTSNAPTAQTIVSSTVTLMVAGSRHTCDVRAGFLRCWGANEYGQSGSGAAWYFPESAAVEL